MKLLITGGGTGGHLFPAIAVAETILRDFPGSKVLFIGTRRKLDATALANRGFDTATIRCQGLKGHGLLAKLRTLALLPVALFESAGLILKFKPDLVFGVGGYVTGPVILAARLLRVPTCIHEQNSVPGLANRILGRIAKRIFISIPGSEKFFPADKTTLTGNPVRAEIQKSRAEESKEGPTLLVLGGSQGAHRINVLMLEALKIQAPSLPVGLKVIHQTGTDDEDIVRANYSAMEIPATVSAFFSNMAEIYQKADLIISRAGATTLAELMVLKKPALLIPYPYAADNHQQKNGDWLVENGAARMIVEADLDGNKLGQEISGLLNDPKTLNKLAANMGRLARPEATQKIIDECLALINAEKINTSRTYSIFYS